MLKCAFKCKKCNPLWIRIMMQYGHYIHLNSYIYILGILVCVSPCIPPGVFSQNRVFVSKNLEICI